MLELALFPRLWRSPRVAGAILLVAALLTTFILLLAPTERTLGEGIRVVYLHVALIWVGMVALWLAGLLGLLVMVAGNRPTLSRWMEAISRVGFAFYLVSGLVSLVAQQVNWGGIAWQEPRTVTMLQILALALIVQVLHGWLEDGRQRGLLHFLLAVMLLWTSQNTPLQLHPDNPVGTSTSQLIRLTFFMLTALFFFVAAWLAAFLQSRRLQL